ncbi:MAG: non-canonical purine NTP pyrophosphatase [Myxococcota bacterium]
MSRAEPETLLVSSRNPDKLAELRDLLGDLPVRVETAASRGVPEVEETGSTFLDNAVLKVSAAWDVEPGPCLADDSGLAVDALDGAPGVESARFAGEDVTYEDNNRLLLERMVGVPEEERTAAFVCTLALLVPEERAVTPPAGAPWRRETHPDAPAGAALYAIEGRAEGRILEAPRGDAGFGYDPLFLYEPAGRTFAEMGRDEKNAISHRGRALAGLRECLEAILRG